MNNIILNFIKVMPPLLTSTEPVSDMRNIFARKPITLTANINSIFRNIYSKKRNNNSEKK